MMTREDQYKLNEMLNSMSELDEIESVLSDDEIFLLRLELDAVGARRRERETAVLSVERELPVAAGWQ